MEYDRGTVFVTGLAKPANEDPISVLYHVFFLSLIVDKETDTIVDATCNSARKMTEDFIREMLVGRNLSEDIDSIVQEIHQRFFGLVQKTLIVALKDARNRYMIAKKTNCKEL